MKVTTELKNLIKEEFQRKISNFTKEYELDAEKQYKNFVKEVESDKDFIQLKKHAQNLYEKYKDKASECNWSNQKSTIAYHTSMFTKLKDIQSSDFFGNNISYYKGKNDDYNYRLAELRKQE